MSKHKQKYNKKYLPYIIGSLTIFVIAALAIAFNIGSFLKGFALIELPTPPHLAANDLTGTCTIQNLDSTRPNGPFYTLDQIRAQYSLNTVPEWTVYPVYLFSTAPYTQNSPDNNTVDFSFYYPTSSISLSVKLYDNDHMLRGTINCSPSTLNVTTDQPSSVSLVCPTYQVVYGAKISPYIDTKGFGYHTNWKYSWVYGDQTATTNYPTFTMNNYGSNPIYVTVTGNGWNYTSTCYVTVSQPQQPTLTYPVITAPAANAVLSNMPRYASLAWTSVSGASYYEVELACDICSSNTTLWLNPETYTTSYNYYTTPALAGDNQFRFHVRARDNNGNIGPWSSYSYFSYKTSSTTTKIPVITQNYTSANSFDPSQNEYVTIYYQFDRDARATVEIWDGSILLQTLMGNNLVTGNNLQQQRWYGVDVNNNIFAAKTYTYKIYGTNDTGTSSTATGKITITQKTVTPKTANVGQYCAGFKDIWTDSPYCLAIKRMVTKGVFGSSEQFETFRPFDNLNRVEAAKVIVAFLDIPLINDYSDLGFSDVSNSEWYAPYLRPLRYMGIIKGFEDGTFKPSNSVTNAEFLAMTLRAAKVDVSTCTSYTFADAPATAWYGKYTCYGKKKGIITGDENNKFFPNTAITRANAAQFLYNTEKKNLFQ
jgi:hypothetical protein